MALVVALFSPVVHAQSWTFTCRELWSPGPRDLGAVPVNTRWLPFDEWDEGPVRLRHTEGGTIPATLRWDDTYEMLRVRGWLPRDASLTARSGRSPVGTFQTTAPDRVAPTGGALRGLMVTETVGIPQLVLLFAEVVDTSPLAVIVAVETRSETIRSATTELERGGPAGPGRLVVGLAPNAGASVLPHVQPGDVLTTVMSSGICMAPTHRRVPDLGDGARVTVSWMDLAGNSGAPQGPFQIPAGVPYDTWIDPATALP